ncbi:Centrosomal protein POC5 [Holothuria leucospilota]|uniref:Centrosomal protein POC5 n=1 Tax=Holothuria leucospilota TaxID=206669 RepID=A0A9Q1BYV6_HOLLE|nr:Centrosomal protein POC5 [Holothuria leucospilota]
MSSEEESSTPMLPSESPGSSVSTTYQEEYNELLKYAVITPHFDPSSLPKTLAEAATYPEKPAFQDPLIFKDTSTDERTPQRPLSAPGAFETPSSSERTSSTIADSPESSGQSPAVDPDIARMSAQLDNWCMELKRNVLAEFSQSKIALIERHRKEIMMIKDRHARELDQLYNEMSNLKELIHTYEQSVERKDQVITNLTRAVQKQKERFEMLKRFESWKLRHSEDKREAFTSRLAKKHHERRMMSRVWAAWHSIIEAKWKQRVEKACQSKAQEVCMKLTNDYEARVTSLNEALEASRAEVAKLHAERDHYEETMKKAFMRGVCALNMEAMTMFHEGEENTPDMQGRQQPPGPGGRMPPVSTAGTYQGPSDGLGTSAQYDSLQEQSVPGRIVTSESALTPGTLTQTHTTSSMPAKKQMSTKSGGSVHRPGSTLKAKITASHGPSRGLAPPMSSVVVERHHPVTQQTVGHATAARYPSSQPPGQGPQGIHIRPGPLGQGGTDNRGGRGLSRKPPGPSGLQTVKVVH